MRQRLRLIALQHQGLTKVRPFGKGREATQRALEHLGYIQIDTLSVVERAHHHTLWTRIPDYQPSFLRQLVQERSAFEYWFHAASYLPMNDYRFALPLMSAVRRGESSFCPRAEPKYMQHVLDRIRIDGPLKARDFESAKKGDAKWWNWKPAKRALERLFLQGDLMITDRFGMEKVYDLTERVLPDNTDTNEPSLLEFSEYLINLSIRANGFTTLKQLTHLRPGEKLVKALKAVLQQKIEQGDLIEQTIEAMPPIFITQKALDARVKSPPTNIRILSPFDNAIIHRDRVQQLFGFDYKLECYTPKEKRKFGYFCLPILYKDRMIGRVDCKAHRKTGDFELIHLHLEQTKIEMDHFISNFSKVVYRFAKLNNCQSIIVSSVSPKKLTTMFRKVLSSAMI
ncbi:winged helix-turn-helix domain-containing protein [Aliikangiella coralliicola]|uniref:Winged helix-turn-helix domain-containing protein n=1 Tax=Aliikangiella coralliicola TaxID=2592383 RepID=A0A545UFJ3_9GAMM|nr:crosslink repair DNA glycosylase YcaQ family protein [Aliikangiella coralliicola]TQV88238.1 winged helix-turn-helix domain-containing protein [Aliikangiella coralliicola]